MDAEKIALAIVGVSLGVPVFRYALAFQAAEPALSTWFGRFDISPLTGLLFGVSYEAAAYLGVQEALAARRRTSKRWWWPLAGALVQTAAGVAILLPVLVAELRGIELAALLSGALAWLWCGVVATATLLTFATVSLALAVQKQERKPSEPKSKYACKVCGYEARHQRALNAHMRVHRG